MQKQPTGPFAESPGTNALIVNLPRLDSGNCRTAPVTGGDLSHAELESHIEDAHWQYRTAYERFQLHGNPCDRDEALQHLHRMNTAILARSAAVQAARHAEFEDRISQGVDFFQSKYALALGRPA